MPAACPARTPPAPDLACASRGAPALARSAVRVDLNHRTMVRGPVRCAQQPGIHAQPDHRARRAALSARQAPCPGHNAARRYLSSCAFVRGGAVSWARWQPMLGHSRPGRYLTPRLRSMPCGPSATRCPQQTTNVFMAPGRANQPSRPWPVRSAFRPYHSPAPSKYTTGAQVAATKEAKET